MPDADWQKVKKLNETDLDAPTTKARHVALYGFYKYADGSVGPMPNDEFYDFD